MTNYDLHIIGAFLGVLFVFLLFMLMRLIFLIKKGVKHIFINFDFVFKRFNYFLDSDKEKL
jgi:hypothetical protein